METFSEKLEYRFLVESTTIESTIFLCEADLSKLMLRQIDRQVQNGPPITKNTVLPLLIFFVENLVSV